MTRLTAVSLSLLLVLGTGVATAAAQPIGYTAVSGTVVNALDEPLPGVQVTDGRGGLTHTDASGDWSLDEPLAGQVTFTFAHPTYETRAQSVIVVPGQRFTLSLLYRATLDVDHVSVMSVPVDITLTMTTTAPTEGFTAWGRAGYDRFTLALVGSAEGLATWEGTYTLVDEGTYDLTFGAWGVIDDRVVTSPDQRSVPVDTEPPSITVFDPSPGWIGTTLRIRLSAWDSKGVDPSSLTISLSGEPVEPNFWGPGTSYVTAQAEADPGPQTLVVSATDMTGHTGTETIELQVDASRPQLADPSPTGEIEDASPMISIRASDEDSGISPTSIRMTLRNSTFLSSQLNPTYEEGSGLISYQVPFSIEGPGLGEFPLPPGRYTVHVSVADLARNWALEDWSFTVLGP